LVIYTQVVKARQEGLSALEKARVRRRRRRTVTDIIVVWQ
jgi:hypothetical protein